ncbi:MAG: hypothetical protein ACKPEY_21925 [Planctomycetota bacterium]
MQRRVISAALILTLIALTAVATTTLGQTKATRTVRRAASPKWQPSETKGVFFDNVFDGKVLVGDRPANLSVAKSAGPANPTAAGATTESAAAGGGGGSGAGWSKVIASSAIEDEIKAIKLMVDKNVTTPTEFAGKGYKEARRNFTILAMLFGIVGDYDGDVRWKKEASTAREVFARTAANAKVGTQQVFNEAKLRKADLDELMSGSGLSAKASADGKLSWAQTCDRSPLMMRLEMGVQGKLQPATASKAEFQGKKDEVQHEAQVVAAIARVLAQETMDDADAAEYKNFCKVLETAAIEILDAVKLNSDEAARKAVGVISKSCDDCHGAYR